MSGGAVSSGNSFLGGFAGSGTVTVDGSGSIWTINGDLTVGSVFGGVGTVSVSQGGRVTSANAFVGDGASSIGTVQVDGADSTWTNSGTVYLGGDATGTVGTGELHLSNGGSASAAMITVWNSGTISGNGFIEATGVTNHGTLAPDQTISINGNLTFDSTAVMSSDVTPDDADSVMAQGSAGLNGHLNVTLTGGPFVVGTQYILLVANGGLNGTTFSNIAISAPPGINAQVAYDVNHVYLVIKQSGGSPTPTATPTPTTTPSSTPRVTPTARPRPTPWPRPTSL